MAGTRDAAARPSAQVVREMMTAMAEGRVGDMLALMDPQITWITSVRPGLSMYYGHEGMTQYAADLRAALGSYRVEFEDITADDGGQVTARLRVLRQTNDGDRLSGKFIIVVEVRDGLTTQVDAQAA